MMAYPNISCLFHISVSVAQFSAARLVVQHQAAAGSIKHMYLLAAAAAVVGAKTVRCWAGSLSSRMAESVQLSASVEGYILSLLLVAILVVAVAMYSSTVLVVHMWQSSSCRPALTAYNPSPIKYNPSTIEFYIYGNMYLIIKMYECHECMLCKCGFTYNCGL